MIRAMVLGVLFGACTSYQSSYRAQRDATPPAPVPDEVTVFPAEQTPGGPPPMPPMVTSPPTTQPIRSSCCAVCKNSRPCGSACIPWSHSCHVTGRLRMLKFAVAVVAMLSGCGAPIGSACSAEGASECNGAKSVAYCESATWKAYACPSGCDSFGGDSKCDWKGVTDGSACPASLQQKESLCFGSLDAHDLHAANCFGQPGEGQWFVKDCVGECSIRGYSAVCP